MNDYVIDSNSMIVTPLNTTILGLPDFDPSIFGAGHHPFALAVESHACNVARVTGEYHQRLLIGGTDVEKLDILISRCRKVSFVWRDAETVDLGVGMLNRSRTDA